MEKGLLTVHGSALALPAEVGFQVLRTGKGDVANLAAERYLSDFNPLKSLSVIVAVVVLFPLA